MVLGEWPFYANIPVKDLQEAKRFYENTLGATPVREDEEFLEYRTGDSLFGLDCRAYSPTSRYDDTD